MLLNSENYTKGFLMDAEYLAGVSQDPENASRFMGFVVDLTQGETVQVAAFDRLEDALHAVNRLDREWAFAPASGCGGGNCKNGNCKGSCKNKTPSTPQSPS